LALLLISWSGGVEVAVKEACLEEGPLGEEGLFRNWDQAGGARREDGGGEGGGDVVKDDGWGDGTGSGIRADLVEEFPNGLGVHVWF
jgi:hypothetical protein